MQLDRAACADYDRISRLEWLETNGHGAFAAGTVAGTRTRRYHGALVAEATPGAGQRLLVAGFEVAVQIPGCRYELSTNQYGDAIYPEGWRLLQGFRLDPWPIWTYRCGDLVVEQHLTMLHEVTATLLTWVLVEGAERARLVARPLIAGRHYHGTATENWSFRRQTSVSGTRLEMQPYDEGSRTVLSFPGGRFDGDGYWFYGFVYPRDRERGFLEIEDLFSPGDIEFMLRPGEPATVAVSAEPLSGFHLPSAMEAERHWREGLVAASGVASRPSRRLVAAAARFVANDATGKPRVTAGFPWFGARLRETLAGLPGLAVATGRLDLAQALLAGVCDDILERDEAFGQSYDGELWLGWAASQALAGGVGRGWIVEHVVPALRALVDRYETGTRTCRLADDGLLSIGEPGQPLTWMDGWCNGVAVTPRTGKPVEKNALWVHLLRCLAEWGDPQDRDHAVALADWAQISFRTRFWDEDCGFLCDVVDGPEGDDWSFRPNQIIAVGLPPGLLTDEMAGCVTQAVGERLVTPFGLRSLDPADPRYRGRYEGDAVSRDEAYHQGPAWPWLLGAYVDALLLTDPAGASRARELLAPLVAHLDDYGAGHLAELFDGDPPHQARGCFASALSTAEILRAWLRVEA